MSEHRMSVGVVLFRPHKGVSNANDSGIREYLLLHYAAGHWDFPKGGVEKNETQEQTLKRELLEETGISELKLIPGFTESFSYFFREKGQLVKKTATFFLGKTNPDAKVTLSFEHKDFAWLSYPDALQKLTHKNAKTLLENADVFLD